MSHPKTVHQLLAAAGLGVTLLANTAHAAMEVTAPNGQRVLLKDDNTWEYIAPDESERYLLLSVARKVELPNACRFGLRLTNLAAVKLQSIVPQFSAYNRDSVVFETVFAAFTQIKPTQEQYQEITFKGIRCEDISRITVHGADRCSVGDLTKFSPATGVCLKYIRVEESPLVAISK
jgi:hypothetical protein